jgi:hypothetical protein
VEHGGSNHSMGKFSSLTGQTFGLLTVLERTCDYEYSFKGLFQVQTQYICECVCGKKLVKRRTDLKNGKLGACSNLCRYKFLYSEVAIGDKFNKFVVVSGPSSKHGHEDHLVSYNKLVNGQKRLMN